MTRYRLTVQYVGTAYSGWQIQQNAPTVQGAMEEALYALTGEKAKVCGVGRTDEGVHAEGFVAHVDLMREITPRKLCLGLNRFLPQDISVVDVAVTDADFDARFSAVSKTYVYRLYVSPFRHALLDESHVQVYQPLDLGQMRRAAALMVGKHDFGAFRSLGSNLKGTVREVLSVDIQTQQRSSAEVIEIYVTGNAFLYNMVRNMAGVLVWVGQGRLTVEEVADMLRLGKRVKHYKTLPPKGLTFVSADYTDWRKKRAVSVEKEQKQPE